MTIIRFNPYTKMLDSHTMDYLREIVRLEAAYDWPRAKIADHFGLSIEMIDREMSRPFATAFRAACYGDLLDETTHSAADWADVARALAREEGMGVAAIARLLEAEETVVAVWLNGHQAHRSRPRKAAYMVGDPCLTCSQTLRYFSGECVACKRRKMVQYNERLRHRRGGEAGNTQTNGRAA
jgi:hypothetical protein